MMIHGRWPTRFWGILFLGLSGLGLPVAAQANLKVPCRAEETPTGSLDECSAVKPRLVQELREHFQDYVDHLYRGKDLGGFGVADRPFTTPVCSLTANLLTGNQKEISRNHLGLSCGEPFQVVWRRRTDSNGHTTVTWSLSEENGRGKWEQALERGAFVQAVACQLEERVRQIEETGWVVSSLPQSVLDDYIRFQKLAESTGSPEMVSKCDFRLNGASRTEVEENNILNCHAGALREQLQGLFKQLLTADILKRADELHHSLRLALYGSADRNIITATHQELIRERCSGITREAQVQDCYRDKFRELLEGMVRKWIVDKGCGSGKGGTR